MVKNSHVIYPSGKAGIPHLLRCLPRHSFSDGGSRVRGPAIGGTASPLTPWSCSILAFCKVRVHREEKPKSIYARKLPFIGGSHRAKLAACERLR